MSLAPTEGFYPVARRETHAWFLLTGTAAASALSKLCAIDLRVHKFPELQVAQTSVAAVGTVILRKSWGETPAFHLLVDTTSTTYLWRELLEAIGEYGGAAVGLHAIQQAN
jgi:sarcosine oxidase subunit gamma